MSIAALLSGAGIAAAATALDTVLLMQGRNIAGIVPDCVIEERHSDDMEITSHPVEQGAAISDHAFKKPAELVMRIAWSTSKSLTNLVEGVVSGGGLSVSMSDIYQQLLTLQAGQNGQVQPFSVVTGKRSYNNMLMRSLRVTTNKESENALMVEATFQEVLIVSTQTAALSSIPPAANQANPQNTAAPVNAGTQQLGQSNAVAGATIGGLQG
jgi:Dit-like phage tail protein